MKFINVCLLLFTMAGLLAAQSFRIDFPDSASQVAPGASVVYEGYIYNTGSITTAITVTRTTDDIPESWSTSICVGATCYPPYVNEASEALNPGDSLFFDITYNTDEIPAVGEAMLRIKDELSGDMDSVLTSVSTMPQSSLAISWDDTLKQGANNELIVMQGYVYNLSAIQTVVNMKRISNDLPQDWTSSICFGATCYPPYVEEANESINPGDSLFYDISFSSSDFSGQGKAVLQFTDMLSMDVVSQTFTALVAEPVPAISAAIGDTAASVVSGESHEFTGYIYNDTDEILTVFMVRDENNIPAGWTTQSCFTGCQSADVDSLNSLINPGDSLEYTVTFNTAGEAASGDAYFSFFAIGKTDTIRQRFTLETTATDIGSAPEQAVEGFVLYGNYPNPFNPTTAISYQLSAGAQVDLSVYNVLGKKVTTLVHKKMAAGKHEVQWDASGFNSGTYFYRLQAGTESRIGKMLLIK